MNRTSFNVLGQFLNAGQKNYYLDFMARYRPTTALIMDDLDLVYRTIAATQGETLVIHRVWQPDDAYLWNWKTPGEYIDMLTNNSTLRRDVILYLLNEPDTRPSGLPRLLEWLIEATEDAIGRGYRCVVGNIGPATIEPATIETGVFREYLSKLAEWSAAGKAWGGWHEYTAVLLPFGIGQWSTNTLLNPAAVQPPWPLPTQATFESLRKNYVAKMAIYPLAQLEVFPPWWHILRHEWLQLWAEENGIPRHKVILTEGFHDRMPDLTAPMPNIYQELASKWGTAGFTELRGVRTLKDVYHAYFPTQTEDETVFQQMEYAETIYPNNVIGWDLFTWCFDAGQDKTTNWEEVGYNVGDMVGFHELLITAKEPPGPSPIPNPDPSPEPTPPAPSDLLWLMLFVCACVVGVVVYSIIAPHIAAQEVNTMEIISIQEASVILMTAIGAILAGGLAAPVTQPVVNFLKYILKLAGQETLVSGNALSLLVAAVVSVAIWLSRHFGVELQAANVMDWLAIALPIVLSGLSMFLSQKGMFALSQRYQIPVFGYTRSTE